MDITPKTYALAAFIDKTLARLDEDKDGAPRDGLLFLGNWHETFPRLLLHDPALGPNEIVIWMALKAHSSPQQGVAHPTYEQLMPLTKLSRASLAAGLTLLRVTRWLTVCARLRRADGRYRGTVHALHDEPLPLCDALYLDPDYLSFVESLHTHRDRNVRQVANEVLTTLRGHIDAGTDVVAHDGIARMDARLAVLGEGQEECGGANPFFAAKTSGVQILNSASASEPSRVQDLNSPAQVQNLNSANSGSSSCSFLNIKTTTTTKKHLPQSEGTARAQENSALVFPSQLTSSERMLAEMHLAGIACEHRQDVLDQLAGRIAAERSNGHAVRDRIGYLGKLCQLAKTGQPILSSLGIRVREERERGAREAQEIAAQRLQGPLATQEGNALAQRVARIREARGAEVQK